MTFLEIKPEKKLVGHCYSCGRFCRVTERRAYNGTWDCLYVTTHCKKCGDIENNET